MASVFEKKRIKHRVGYVADYCEVCHEITTAEFSHVDWARRYLFVPLGRAVSLGSQIQCTVCCMQSVTHVHRYASIQRKRPPNLQALIQATFPNIHEVYAPKFTFEKLLREGLRLMPEDRLKMLTEPMFLLNVPVAGLFVSEGFFDKQLFIRALITLISLGIVIKVAKGILQMRIPNNDTWQMVLLSSMGCFIVAFIYTLVQLRHGKHRILRRKFCPILARSMARLRPTREEVTQCIEQCRSQGAFIGHVLKADDLWAALQRIDPVAKQSEPGRATP